MNRVRYIGLTTAAEAGEEFGVPDSGGSRVTCARLKVEEAAYDRSTRQSTLRVTVQVKASFAWSNADYMNYSRMKLTVGGTRITKKASYDYSTVNEWADIWVGELVLPARTDSEHSCTLVVASADPSWVKSITVDGVTYACCTILFSNNATFAIAVNGSYTIPLSGNGSVVYIGGEAYRAYIGNGDECVPMDIYIGGEKY